MANWMSILLAVGLKNLCYILYNKVLLDYSSRFLSSTLGVCGIR